MDAKTTTNDETIDSIMSICFVGILKDFGIILKFTFINYIMGYRELNI